MKKIIFLIGLISVAISGCGLEETLSSEGIAEGASGDSTSYKMTTENFISDVDHNISHFSDEFLSLTPEGKAFIKDNLNFFFQQTETSIKEAKSMTTEIDLKELNKNASPFLTTFTSFSGTIIQIDEYEYGDTKVTHVIVENNEFTHYEDEYNYFTIIIFGETESILDEDYVVFYGLPVGKYAYDNTLGGQTISQMFLGSSIEEVEN